MNELPFEKTYPKTPTEIFRVIDNQSVNQKMGEILIERYGDHRVKEALADLQDKMGIELNEEVGQRISRIGKTINDFYEKMIEICPHPKKKGGK